jgi:hypothetical protein
MRTLSSSLKMTLAGAAALLAAVGCKSSSGTSDGGGGGGNIVLTPTSTGFVQNTASGIIGAWYSYGDSAGPGANINSTDPEHSDCVAGALTAIPPGTGGFTVAQCTQIVTPIPGQPFVPDPTNGMCTSGIGAQVIDSPGTTTPDYSDLFGGGIGLDLNNPGGEAGVKGDIDLSKYTGFSFTFSAFTGAPAGAPSTIPAGNKIRVNFPFTGEHGTDSPYWAANKIDDHSPISTTGTNTIHWADVFGPAYLATRNPPVPAPPFYIGPGADALAGVNKLQAIQFQVFTNTSTTTPYGFCVNNLTLLTD